MAVVIRLQGLIITAGSEDIRNFFTGLKIPDGGVHIVGGEMDEAFIIFASDEDARRAMTRSEGCIKGSPVRLLLSSKSEMQSVLESSSKIAELNQKRPRKEDLRRREINAAPPSHVKNLSADTRSEGSESAHRSRLSWLERNSQNRKAKLASAEDAYLSLTGLPFSVTEEEVKHFFQGIPVDGVVLLKNERGQNNGKAVVKFKSILDAREGQKRDLEYIGTRFVEIYAATKKIWLESGGGEFMNVESRSGMPPAHTHRNIPNSARSRSPLGHRTRSASPSNEEFCILLENLSYSVDKKNILKFFSPARLQDDQILYLLDSDGRRTRSVFVLFRSLRDYCAALTRHKEELFNRCVYISPISREKMISILESSSIKEGQPERSDKSQERSSRLQSDPYESDKVCLYVRNMPFDVRKVEIMDFFHGFNISEDTVVLLRDDNGAGLGEALVVFRSEEEAISAQSLNGQRFLGSEVMLKCISRFQMQEFGVEAPLGKGQMPRERSPEMYSTWTGEASRYCSNAEYSDFRDSPGGNISQNDLQVHIQGSSSLDTYTVDSYKGGPYGQQDRDTSLVHRGFENSAQQFDGPTCLKLVNLPPQIRMDEIYDFCYGYRVIPGSVSLQYDKNGVPKGSATVVFDSRQEALTAVKDLSGRPIGTRKIKLVFV